jgi:hypothetical protein
MVVSAFLPLFGKGILLSIQLVAKVMRKLVRSCGDVLRTDVIVMCACHFAATPSIPAQAAPSERCFGPANLPEWLKPMVRITQRCSLTTLVI